MTPIEQTRYDIQNECFRKHRKYKRNHSNAHDKENPSSIVAYFSTGTQRNTEGKLLGFGNCFIHSTKRSERVIKRIASGGKAAGYSIVGGIQTVLVDRSWSGGKKNNERAVLPDGVDGPRMLAMATGEFLTRDLVNTPASDMGPAELEADLAYARGE